MKRIVCAVLAGALIATTPAMARGSRDDNDGWVLDCNRPGIFNAIMRGMMPFACK